MNTHTKRRGIFASVGALLTAAALALTGAGLATAAPTIPDSGATANLHITKLTTPRGGAEANANGAQQATPAGSTGIAGVGFSVTQIPGINLGTNAGWQTAATYTLDLTNPETPVVKDGSNSAVDLTGATSYTGTTGAGGVLDFTDKPIGLYLVQETSTPAGVTPAVPFLVTLPITNPTDKNAWVYNVYVYPKNSTTAITKTVDDSAAWKSGDTVTWTIKADVPRIPGSAAGAYVKPTDYVITDTIPANLKPTGVTVSSVKSDGTSASTTLDSGDYTITPSDLSAAAAGDDVTVTFTATGLGKLQTLAATEGTKIQVVVTTQVTGSDLGAVSSGAAQNIENSASVKTTANGKDTTATTSSDPVTKWTTLSFTKKLTDGTTTSALSGATFTLYKTKAAADAGTTTGDDVLGVSTSADSTGTVTFAGLRASDFQNNETLTDGSLRVYWLAETAAPAGAELLADTVPVVLGSDGKVYNATSVNTTTNTGTKGTELTEIVDVEKNAGFTLPLTGGTGTLVLTIGGIAILAVVLLVARRRRSSEAAAE
ncbi:SpaH/EbpB family LPXTG-anchored major pilin [Pseudoclavibacter soli]|uniref:SpaH/EbpB family LPXTG-anchored major pilin n=1 Tax=Pseudoclavibacter soli TaxID=452623 RepID=UPI000416F068|nr:SpaH/EbpB family LPXTG-anchored major pilin [Pseudoclavibacter soli]